MYPASIGKVAAWTGCNRETIRFYEKQGLLPEPERTEGGHRLYTEATMKRLIFIRRARELGFSLTEIRQLLSVVDGKRISCKRVKKITDAHLHDVRSRIRDLKNIEQTLSMLSSRCLDKNTPECPVINVLRDMRSPSVFY